MLPTALRCAAGRLLSPAPALSWARTTACVDAPGALRWLRSSRTVRSAGAGAGADAEAAAAAERARWSALTDDQLVDSVVTGKLPSHLLEKKLGDCTRAVAIRRAAVARQLQDAVASGELPVQTPAAVSAPTRTPAQAFSGLPVTHWNVDGFYDDVFGTNCEAVVGYLPLPVGIVGPLVLDGTPFMVPMATTEGALVASTNRGCRAIFKSGGAKSVVTGNGMTRAPLVHLPSLREVENLLAWVHNPDNFVLIKTAFDSTSRFGRLQSVTGSSAGRNVYLRFKCSTGDAMGMNMITKGVNEALGVIQQANPSMRVLSLSGNLCSDKKPSAINWLDGRGKSVSCEVVIPPDVLSSVLKTDVASMLALNTSKNLVGSSMAGSLGGFNAHASNMVTAVFLATGQDAAQNVESSNCMTLMDAGDDGSLIASVTMPSVEVGTVGGGTSLAAQRAMLDLMGIGGACEEEPGRNAETLARVVAGTVLAGELSLLAALTTNDLLKAHMDLNRKVPAPEAAATASPTTTPPATAATAKVAATGTRALGTSLPGRVQRAALSPGREFFTTKPSQAVASDLPALSVP